MGSTAHVSNNKHIWLLNIVMKMIGSFTVNLLKVQIIYMTLLYLGYVDGSGWGSNQYTCCKSSIKNNKINVV